MKHLSSVPALVIAAQHQGDTISSLVGALREEGLGGQRTCRKLIYRLENLGLLRIVTGDREDRREKSVTLTPAAKELLSELRDELQRASL